MISKDLLYALQTRSKNMIRLLGDFTDDIKSHSLEEGWTVVAETISLVKELPPTQAKYNHIIKAINRAWLSFGEQSPAAANRLYDAIVSTLDGTSWTNAQEAQAAYQLLYAFHDNPFYFPGKNNCLHLALRQYSPTLLEVIKRISAHATQKLFSMPIKPYTGIGTDAIELLLEIYFYHGGLDQVDDLKAEAADQVFSIVQAAPHFGNVITLALIERSPERSSMLSRLIDFYITAVAHDELGGMFYDIMLDLLDNSGGSFIYDDLDKITAETEVYSKSWTASQLDTFTHYAFFYGLKTDEDRRLLMSKSKKAMRLATTIVDGGHSGTHIDTLRSLCQVTGSPSSHPAPSGQGAQQFKDINFKLLVIEELMYKQTKLLPRFDVHEFVRQYTGREIMIEKEGYDIIPEVLAYFEKLLIPASLLAQVEKLAFDGSSEIYRQIFPYWDGECDIFDVASADDVSLVPNLKSMSSMPSRFVELYGAELGKKSIEVS